MVLAFTPAVMLTAAIPLADRVEPRIFGLPFLMAWITLWSILTPVCLYLIFRIEGRRL